LNRRAWGKGGNLRGQQKKQPSNLKSPDGRVTGKSGVQGRQHCPRWKVITKRPDRGDNTLKHRNPARGELTTQKENRKKQKVEPEREEKKE